MAVTFVNKMAQKWRQSRGFIPSFTLRGIYRQESLANAKVSARQQCVYEGPYPYRPRSQRQITLGHKRDVTACCISCCWPSKLPNCLATVRSGVASYGAPGRVPPRLPTSYFQIRVDSCSKSTRKVDIMHRVARSGASG